MGGTMDDEHRLRAVLFQEDGLWVAQCLEVNVAAQAPAFKDILYELQRVLVGRFVYAEKRGIDALAGLPMAPKRYWEMFESASASIHPLLHDDFPQGKRPELELRAA